MLALSAIRTDFVRNSDNDKNYILKNFITAILEETANCMVSLY